MNAPNRICPTCVNRELPLAAKPCEGCWRGDQWVQADRRIDARQRLLDDQKRLEWLFPVLTKIDDPAGIGGPRTAALGAALMLGKSGRDAIDFAMEGSP